MHAQRLGSDNTCRFGAGCSNTILWVLLGWEGSAWIHDSIHGCCQTAAGWITEYCWYEVWDSVHMCDCAAY